MLVILFFSYLIIFAFCQDGTFAPMVEYNSYGAPVPCMQGSTVYSSNLNQFVYFGGIASPNISPYRYRYDVGSNTWLNLTVGNGGPSGRWGHTGVAYSPLMIIFGGSGPSSVITGNDMIWHYWLEGGLGIIDTWIPVNPPNLPGGRYGHAAVIINGIMYIYGGYNYANSLNDLWAYNISSTTFTQLSPTGTNPGARIYHTAVAVGGKMLIFGGSVNSVAVNTLYIYDPVANSYTAGASAPGVMLNHQAVTVNDLMFTFGGEQASPAPKTLYCYTPSSNSWTTLTPSGTSSINGMFNGNAIITGDNTIYFVRGEYAPSAYNTGVTLTLAGTTYGAVTTALDTTQQQTTAIPQATTSQTTAQQLTTGVSGSQVTTGMTGTSPGTTQGQHIGDAFKLLFSIECILVSLLFLFL